MKEAVVVTKSDVRKILAQWFCVEEKDVLPSKFSFTVIKEADEKVVQKSGTKFEHNYNLERIN